MQDRHAQRILEIDFTTDNSDDDIESIDAVTYFFTGQSRTAAAGFSPDATASDGEGGTKSALGTTLGSNEVWIWLSEQIPPPNVIVLDQATQA